MRMKAIEACESRVAMDQDMAGAQDTIYLCNFRVSVDGEWLCLKELHDVEFNMQDSLIRAPSTPSPDGPCPALARDPVMIERSNLVNISKLVVKELIEQSLRYGRMLDSDHMPLQHFFIVLEHVLRHGLRPKKGLLGPKKELWDILQMVEKYASEAQDITASVRDLPTVRTHMGRARAWLRLALMQKKLADYLKVLIDHKDEALAEYFEPDALMLSDEAVIIIGLLVGLNVIDCNLCVKEEDLDYPQGVIDFSLYLRSSNQIADETNEETTGDNMTTVLDQKNYIEELNRHLNATVANLQVKVESLTTTNALMKEDLAISKNNLLGLYDENLQLKQELGRDFGLDRDDNKGKSSDRKFVDSSELEELRQRLDEERKLRQESDKELELQMCLKAEMEVAMKLLEKDIHEKQDTIISLRRQLDDIKLINLEMYKKLQQNDLLWNKTNINFKAASKKAVVWERIGVNFKLTGQQASQTFVSLRQKYIREKEKGTADTKSGAPGGKPKTPWFLMSLMRFVDAVIAPRKNNIHLQLPNFHFLIYRPSRRIDQNFPRHFLLRSLHEIPKSRSCLHHAKAQNSVSESLPIILDSPLSSPTVSNKYNSTKLSTPTKPKKFKSNESDITALIAAIEAPVHVQTIDSDDWKVKDEVKAFCKYIATRLNKLPDNVRYDFENETLNHLYNVEKSSKE